MRFSLLYTGAALAASLALAACSSSSGSVPLGGQSSASTGHSGKLVPVAHRRDPSGNYSGYCPGTTTYLYCYWISPGTSFSQGWEENCLSYSICPGTWYWKPPASEKRPWGAYALKSSNGARYKLISFSFPPKSSCPGACNPSTQTVTVGAGVPPSESGAIDYYVTIRVCSNNSPEGPNYCDTPLGETPYKVGVIIL
jgi:hypothetical protein